MKKYFIFLLISLLLFSCAKEEKDDSYKYLYDKLDEDIRREENMMDSEYYLNYSKIENDSLEIKRYDSLYKVSSEIGKKLSQLDFSDRNKVLKFRDSIIAVHNSPYKLVNKFDYLKLNDSVFKKKIEIEILNIRQAYNGLLIYRYTGLKDENK